MSTISRIVGLLLVASLGVALTCPGAIAQQSSAGQRQSAPGRDAARSSRSVPSRRVYPRVGRRVPTLPRSYEAVRVGPTLFRYHEGVFYRPVAAGVHVVVAAPLGARVRRLPPGYLGFVIGSHRYFYVNFTYYLWDEGAREYVVIEEPAGAETAVVAASESTGELFVYPAQGQSEEQRDRDRYECYLWAADQTGFDPGEAEPETSRAGDYRRAMSACLEGRGYAVE
jgi:hypothetical protein